MAKGFTLVELLVLIAVISILSTITIVSTKNYLEEANTARSQSIIDNIDSVVSLGNVSRAGYGDLYINGAADILKFFDDAQYQIRQTDEYCFVYLAIDPNNTSNPEWPNQYVFATWSDSTSTLDPNSAGILFKSTPHSTGKILTMVSNRDSTYYRESFLCDNWQSGNSYLDEPLTEPKFRFRRDWFVNGALLDESLRYWHPSGLLFGTPHVEMVIKSGGNISCRHNENLNTCDPWDG